MTKKKILIVGMADSIHLARWLLQFKDSPEYSFRLVSSSPHRRIHPLIQNLIKLSGQENASYSIGLISQYMSLPLWILDRLFDDNIRGALIGYEIRQFRPAMVHVNELQNAGYATLKALRWNKIQPLIFCTNYGSELYWYKKFKRHNQKLKSLLGVTDWFSAECKRDYELARELGFQGKFAELIPVSGGLAVNSSSVERDLVAIKGYQNRWGKALRVLDLVDQNRHLFKDLTIMVFSANQSVVRRCRSLRNSGLNIYAHKKGVLGHDEVQRIMSRSLFYIGFSLSDGISTSMIEAMASGAIPIQTNTSCASEWISDGITGFLIDPSAPEKLLESIRSIVDGKFPIEQARAANYATIRRKCGPQTVAAIAHRHYQEALGNN